MLSLILIKKMLKLKSVLIDVKRFVSISFFSKLDKMDGFKLRSSHAPSGNSVVVENDHGTACATAIL